MVLNEPKNRLLEDIIIVSTDNLSRFAQTIETVYLNTKIQKCVIHQIKNSRKFISYKT